MINKITINIHSFIDIITNSSTEIFIQATEQTVKNLKSLIDSILAIGGSTLKCNDVFEMKLKKDNPYDDYDDEDDYNDDNEYDVTIEAKPLIEGANAKLASEILTRLTHLFETGERQC